MVRAFRKMYKVHTASKHRVYTSCWHCRQVIRNWTTKQFNNRCLQMLYRPFGPYDSYLITAPADGSYSSVLAGAVSSYTTSSSAAGVCVASWLLLHCCSAMIALPEVLADSLDTTHMLPGTSRMCYSCALIFFFCCLTVVRLYHHTKWKYFPSPSFVVLNISLLISLISKAIFCLLVHCVCILHISHNYNRMGDVCCGRTADLIISAFC